MCVSDSVKNITVLSQPDTPEVRILPVSFQLMAWADWPGQGDPFAQLLPVGGSILGRS